jgi:uncharacterized membrane protein (UPF0127 family)
MEQVLACWALTFPGDQRRVKAAPCLAEGGIAGLHRAGAHLSSQRCQESSVSARLVRILLGLVTALWFSASAAAEPLVIHAGGSAYKFEVEIVTTPETRAQGLMFRKSLAPNAGMLFIYPGEQPVSFWMKNTLIPLDMLFVRADGSIAHIAHNAAPLDETPIDSGAAVKAVLEVNGGTADALGIKEGDRVEYQDHPAR